MFSYATSFNQDIGDWSVSNVTDMNNMFHDATAFNQDIGRWDVSAVIEMDEMFWDATAFNQDIGDWNASAVTDMSYMFEDAASFDRDIGRWSVSAVTDMTGMFSDATSFNQDIGDWGLGRYPHEPHVRLPTVFNRHGLERMFDMSYMFSRATSFNQDIGDWNVSAVTDMSYMFEDAASFNQDIGSWNVSAVTDMNDMFEEATSFNRDLGGWDTSAVTRMNGMFEGATSFDQDLGDWSASGVTEFDGMFAGAESLSDANKALTHQSFASNATWSYDWSAYLLDLGLVAHWTFDETNGTILGDSSGNDVNGTLNGFSSQTNTHWVPGRVGGALHFDGTDDYVSFPGATLLNDLAPMTFAGWVFRETDPDGVSNYLIAKRSGGAGYWRLNSGNTDLSWVRDISGPPPSYTSTSPTVLDQWTHLCIHLERRGRRGRRTLPRRLTSGLPHPYQRKRLARLRFLPPLHHRLSPHGDTLLQGQAG